MTELTEAEIKHYLGYLTEELTNFDCGSLCSDENGVPYCCSTENAIPLLYTAEFSWFSKHTRLWSPWKPDNKEDLKMKKEDESKDTMYCTCQGVKKCKRPYRSISCRIFPLEPYIDRRGVFSGLVFMKEFEDSCPLGKKQGKIRQQFVDQHYNFWEKLMFRLPEEFETYKASSIGMRISAKRKNRKIHILFPSWLKKSGLEKFI